MTMKNDSDLVPTPENDIVFWLKTRKNDNLAVVAANEIENLRGKIDYLEYVASRYVGKAYKEGAD